MINRILNLVSSFIFKRNTSVIFQIGSSHFALMREKYSKIKDLNELDYKVYSQAGEDGIIDYLLYSLKIKKPKFVEIGVGDYRESNTRFVFEKTSCQGLIIDVVDNLEKKVRDNIKFWKGDLAVVEKEINSENIIETLNKENFYKDIDFFSIDIDGIDYWVLEKLPNEFSKIIVAEYNANFGDKLKVSVPNIQGFQRKKYHYSHLCFGASIKALTDLLDKKGYTFLGSNLFRTNAFFILKKFRDKISIDLSNVHQLDRHVDSHIRESRDQNGKLNFLAGKSRIKEIENCEVIDLFNSEKKLVKLKDIC